MYRCFVFGKENLIRKLIPTQKKKKEKKNGRIDDVDVLLPRMHSQKSKCRHIHIAVDHRIVVVVVVSNNSPRLASLGTHLTPCITN